MCETLRIEPCAAANPGDARRHLPVGRLLAHIRLLLGLLVIWAGLFGPRLAVAHEEPRTDAYLFWRTGCPFCEEARSYLDRLGQEIPDLKVESLEVSSSAANRAVFVAVSQALGIEQPVVPIVVVGGRAFVGYLDDGTTGAAIRRAVLDCRENICADMIGELMAAVPSQSAPLASKQGDSGTSQSVQVLSGDGGRRLRR